MICPKCGTDNPDYYVFCQNCFEELPKVDKPHKSTSRIAQTPIEQFAEPQAQQERPASAINKETANDILNQYASFQQQGVKNPDEPYLTQKQYTRQEVPREDIRMDFDASKRQTPPAKPRLLPMDETSYEYDDNIAPMPARRQPQQQPQQLQPHPQAQSSRRVTPAQGRTRQPEPEFDEFSDDLYDDMTTTIVPRQVDAKPQRPQKAQKPAKAPKRKPPIDDVEEPYNPYDDYEDEDMYAERKRGKIITIVFWVALFVLIGAVLFFATSYAIGKYGSVGEAFSAVFNLESAPKQLKVVAGLTDEGEPMHQFFVTGKVGQQMSFDDLGRAFDLKDTERAFKVPDAYWIAEEPDPNTDKLTINPKLSIIDKETGEVLSNPTVEPFEIVVPQATLSITSPAPAEGVMVTGSALEITGAIEPIAGRLKVNGEDANSSLAADGTFKHTVELTEFGEFSIEVVASAGRTRSVSQTITGTYEKGEIAITLSDDLPERTDAKEVTVSGTIDPGSELVVEGPMKESMPTYDSATGAFSFTASFGDYGSYTYKISAKQGEVVSEKTFAIARIPEVTKYTESAKALDYAKVKKNPNDSSGGVYNFKGVLVEAQTTDEGTKYLFAADGDGEKPVLVTYFGSSELTPETTYNVYATANKNTADNSAIQMNAYFIFGDNE